MLMWENTNTYDDPEGEHICRLDRLPLEKCLGTTPVLVARYHIFDAPTTRKLGRVIKVGKLNLLKHHSSFVMMVVDHEFVCYHVCCLSVFRIVVPGRASSPKCTSPECMISWPCNSARPLRLPLRICLAVCIEVPLLTRLRRSFLRYLNTKIRFSGMVSTAIRMKGLSRGWVEPLRWSGRIRVQDCLSERTGRVRS